MKATPDLMTVSALLELRKAGMLNANPEYQRGQVWGKPQKKRLIDSVLRGYPIPLIYLHHRKQQVAGISREDFEVIDGQQRINALYEFGEGAFKLFDPILDEEEARFPSFIKDVACPWGQKNYVELAKELQEQFLSTKMHIVRIETDVANEARDLFIRLQAGMPLNSQEKRDAWPGNFTEFVLRLAGKPELARYPGHDFFTRVMKARVNDRGKFRQFAAQLALLFLTRRESGPNKFCDINREALDTCYYKHLTFDVYGPESKRLNEILSLLTALLGDGKRKKILGHEAFHLVLMVDTLWDDYTRSWTSNVADAFDHFREHLAKGVATRFHTSPTEYWTRYGVLTRTNTDRADTIQRRHEFFLEKMYPRLKPVMKDPNRIFGGAEREIIYYRDKQTCQVCDASVTWDDSEIHHVHEHSKGGQTVLANGALVHKHCHPKGQSQTEAFAKKWKARAASA